MGTFLIILILLFLIWPLIRGPVSRWFNSFVSHRTEDVMRRMMGMPSRREEKRRRKQQAQKDSSTGRGYGRKRNASPPKPHPAAMMKSVAVDVEYTEIREFESKTTIDSDGKTTRIKTEEQISDAEYIEIKE